MRYGVPHSGMGRVLVRHTDIESVTCNLPEPVLIVGVHSSGTSIVSEILHRSGLFLRANERHYESRFFSIFVNDILIMGGKGNWSRLPIMDIETVMSFVETVGMFVRKYWIADYLQWGYDGVSQWGFKDPRLCVLLPLYLEIFPKAKVVHILRNPDDVALSLCNTPKGGVVKKHPFSYWKKFIKVHTGRVLKYADKCHAYHRLTYEDFCRKSVETTKLLFDFLDLEFTEHTVESLSKVNTSRIGTYKMSRKERNK
jgi:hypothetical protein